MEFHGTKEAMRKIILDAVPDGSFDKFDKGLRYRSEYGATITWFSNTGKVQVEEPWSFAGMTQDRLRNFIHPDRPPIITIDRMLWPRHSADFFHQQRRSKAKAPKNAAVRPR